ncbi:hypothetical protein [Symbiopectobacterium purcellii]|uniref:hypothetical protein n=1 Tax=Symbiopectobacterium purcellii TaxID=2871826 RepID=UPI003F824FA0
MLGSHARMSGIDLSVLWPVNILVAALFYRCRGLNTPWYYCVAYSAMIAQDSLIYGWGVSALTIIANRLKNDYILCPDMRQRSIAGCYQNNVAWL